MVTAEGLTSVSPKTGYGLRIVRVIGSYEDSFECSFGLAIPEKTMEKKNTELSIILKQL